LQVWAPQVIYKEVDWEKMEPMETLVVSVEDDLSGTVIDMLAPRKWLMQNMNSENWLTTMEFLIPTRGLLWFRWEFILVTKWEGIMYSSFSHYEKYKWDIPKRQVWSMISSATWTAMMYWIFKLQERGPIFVDPAQPIYEWMIVWEHLKWGDMTVNLTINKQMNNVRNSWNDEAMRIDPIVHLTLEQAMWYIGLDELVEITPKTIRIRKKYLTEASRTIARKQWLL
jgi:GTP-binding protein